MKKDLKDRKYKLSINDGKTIKIYDDLDLSFKIKKNGSIAPNELDLDLYNLKKQNRESLVKKGNLIILEAGYKSDFGIVFKGTIEDGDSRFEAPEWVTSIESKDGFKELKTIIASKSFEKKSSKKSVIEYVAKQMGIKIGNLSGMPEGNFENGYSLSGPAYEQLKKLLAGKKVDFSIQDGVLNIVPINQSTNKTAIVLNESSGLIGTPKKTKTGWTFSSVIRPGINPNTLLKVESKTVTGFFVAKDVTLIGQTFGDNPPWDLEIEAIAN